MTVIEKRDLIKMIDRWRACNEGRVPTEAENERRRCAKELERWVRHRDRKVVDPDRCACGEMTLDAITGTYCKVYRDGSSCDHRRDGCERFPAPTADTPRGQP